MAVRQSNWQGKVLVEKMGVPQPSKAIAWLCAILIQTCCVGFFASLAYFIYLSRHSPFAPSVATGQTVALNNHGSFFYVRFWDAVLAQSGFVFVGATFAVGSWARWRYGAFPDVVPKKIFGHLVTVLVVVFWAYMFWPLFKL